MNALEVKIMVDRIFQAVPNLEEEGQKVFKERGSEGLDKFCDEIIAKHIPGAGKQQWDKNPLLRAEFGSFEAYKSYLRAEAEGRIKIAGNKIIR